MISAIPRSEFEKAFEQVSEKEKRRKLGKNQTFVKKNLWNYLRNRKTLGYKFRRQYSVEQFRLDFYCPELKLAIIESE